QLLFALPGPNELGLQAEPLGLRVPTRLIIGHLDRLVSRGSNSIANCFLHKSIRVDDVDRVAVPAAIRAVTLALVADAARSVPAMIQASRAHEAMGVPKTTKELFQQ